MKVGFIGLGNMGLGMAHNLAFKGFDLTVYDQRPEPVAKVVAEGAVQAESVAGLGDACDIVCIAVFDEAQVDQVVFGTAETAGLLDRMKPGGIIILHPTMAPSAVIRVAEAARARHVEVLDAPMTGGGDVAAMAGTLTFMVGADATVLEQARPVLEAMSKSIFPMGPVGTGVAAKIVNNYVSVSNILAVREAIRLAKGIGGSEEMMLRILNDGNVASSWWTHHWEALKTQEKSYTTGPAGIVAMATKDMHLAARAGREADVDMPALGALLERGIPDMALSGMTDNGIEI